MSLLIAVITQSFTIMEFWGFTPIHSSLSAEARRETLRGSLAIRDMKRYIAQCAQDPITTFWGSRSHCVSLPLSITTPEIHDRAACSYPLAILDCSKTYLKTCNFVIRYWLDRLQSAALHDILPSPMIQHFVRSMPITTSGSPHVGCSADVEILMIFQTIDSWIGVRGVPMHADIVVPFRIYAGGDQAIFNIATLVCNLQRSFLTDGEPKSNVCALSFTIDISICVGFVAFADISPNWIVRAETTPMFDVIPDIKDTYISTWPLCRDDLATANLVFLTLKESREKNRKILEFMTSDNPARGYRRLKKRRLNIVQCRQPLLDHSIDYDKNNQKSNENSLWFPFCEEASNAIVLNELVNFDNDLTFGPGAGSTRLERYRRAVLLGLQPPEQLEWILEIVDRDVEHPWRLTRITRLLQ
ncbi:hypothetical protein F5877DRAFT_70182 [Lentinula edodes]|nr:hypothetical protein F5877DRAFT_70182 [Lentinula edodes]